MIHKLPLLAFDILDQIAKNKTMTQEEINQVLDADQKSIKYAIRRLQENQVIQQIPDLLDMRIVHYRLPEPDEMSYVQTHVSEELMEKLDGYLHFNLHSNSTERMPMEY